MFCSEEIGVVSTQTNWILQPICNARPALRWYTQAEWPPRQAGEDMVNFSWHERCSVVKLASKCKEGRIAVYDDWWVSDEVRSAAGLWIWTFFFRQVLQGYWFRGQRRQNEKENWHKTLQRVEMEVLWCFGTLLYNPLFAHPQQWAVRLQDYFWSSHFFHCGNPSLACAAQCCTQMPSEQYRYMKGRKCQHSRSLMAYGEAFSWKIKLTRL